MCIDIDTVHICISEHTAINLTTLCVITEWFPLVKALGSTLTREVGKSSRGKRDQCFCLPKVDESNPRDEGMRRHHIGSSLIISAALTRKYRRGIGKLASIEADGLECLLYLDLAGSYIASACLFLCTHVLVQWISPFSLGLLSVRSSFTLHNHIHKTLQKRLMTDGRRRNVLRRSHFPVEVGPESRLDWGARTTDKRQARLLRASVRVRPSLPFSLPPVLPLPCSLPRQSVSGTAGRRLGESVRERVSAPLVWTPGRLTEELSEENPDVMYSLMSVHFKQGSDLIDLRLTEGNEEFFIWVILISEFLEKLEGIFEYF